MYQLLRWKIATIIYWIYLQTRTNWIRIRTNSIGTREFLFNERCISFTWIFLKINYFDNQIICRLVEHSNSGLLAYLDQACQDVNTMTNEIFLNTINREFRNDEHYSSWNVRHCWFLQFDWWFYFIV